MVDGKVHALITDIESGLSNFDNTSYSSNDSKVCFRNDDKFEFTNSLPVLNHDVSSDNTQSLGAFLFYLLLMFVGGWIKLNF
eukprot:Pgem_evm2s17143